MTCEPPDLTRGEAVDRSQTHNLGATGLRGSIRTAAVSEFDGVQGRTTTSSRQILVTHVCCGSPADGVMEPGDVILAGGWRRPEVLPRVADFALARGQGRFGTFGHGFSEPAAGGGLHGPIPPFGPVTAAGLIGNLAIVMGRRCGVTDPEVTAAIDRGTRFFRYCAGKGAIPYGEHLPWPHHDTNGKNAMAAVFFALQRDRPQRTRVFSRMVTASFRNREYGHTGQGFRYLWGLQYGRRHRLWRQRLRRAERDRVLCAQRCAAAAFDPPHGPRRGQNAVAGQRG